MTTMVSFLPWVSEGLAAHLDRARTGVNRPTVELALEVDGADKPDASVSLPLLAPGDVTGIAAAQVIRTEPADGARAVEDTLFAGVEFDSAALPWLFSPDRPTAPKQRP